MKYLSIVITFFALGWVVGCMAAPAAPTPAPALSLTPSASGGTVAPTAAFSQAPTARSPVPAFSHIYVIVLENKEYDRIIGSSNAPFLNSLAAKYGLAVNYTGVAHPSQPNYIALFSGSTHSIEDNQPYELSATNLADQIEAAGKTWKIFAQNVPLDCFTGLSADGGEDGPGTYTRKHNPAISFVQIQSSPERCANITNFTQFDPAAADFELIVPNMCNQMHDCSVAAGDEFLKGFVPRILNSDAWKENGVLFVIFDEGNSDAGGGGRISALVVSNRVPAGMQSETPHNHYSLLRTIEDAWGLPCLENACTAKNLGEFFP